MLPSSSPYQWNYHLRYSIGRRHCVLGFDIFTTTGTQFFVLIRRMSPEEKWLTPEPGTTDGYVLSPGGLLNGGTYYLCPRISVHNTYWIVLSDAPYILRFCWIMEFPLSGTR